VTAVVLVAGGLLLGGSVVTLWTLRLYRAVGGSMHPTIDSGQRLLSFRFPYWRPADIRRGDVVTFRYPNDPGIVMVQRVIGLPGETIHLAAGRPSVNGVPASQVSASGAGDQIIREAIDSVSYDVVYGGPCDDGQLGEVILKADEFYMLGDNRCASHDSRHFGPVPFRLVTGRVLRVE
jgi:signal peptidase I